MLCGFGIRVSGLRASGWRKCCATGTSTCRSLFNGVVESRVCRAARSCSHVDVLRLVSAVVVLTNKNEALRAIHDTCAENSHFPEELRNAVTIEYRDITHSRSLPEN